MQAMLEAPKELSVEDIRKIAPNLAVGLAKLGIHLYSISKEGEGQFIVAGKAGEQTHS
jgi:hypothetical protein